MKDIIIVILAFMLYLSILIISDSAFADERVFEFKERGKAMKHTFIYTDKPGGEGFGVYFKKPYNPYNVPVKPMKGSEQVDVLKNLGTSKY